MATITINEMIYKTLTTKTTKEPKYKKELEALGLEIIVDGWSGYYNYWSIRNPLTDRELVISKDYAGRKNIFNPYDSIAKDSHHIQKIDFLGYLSCNRPSYNERLPKKSKYREWRETLKDGKYWKDYHEKRIQKLEIEKEKLDTAIHEQIKYCNKYQDKIDTVRYHVKDIKARKENK